MSDLTPQQEFEEKIKDRIRDSIGDLMPDEVLTQVLERLIQQTFFTSRKVDPSAFHSATYFPFEKFVEDQLQERCQALAQEWMKDNSHKVESIIRQHLEDCVEKAVLRIFSKVTTQPIYEMENRVTDTFQNMILQANQ